MNKRFKSIPGYEGRYSVDNKGSVFSNYLNGLMKLNHHSCGYLKISLNKGSKRKSFFVHRLVAEAFIGKSELDVNHKNCNKKDNRITNLEYVTRSHNLIHARNKGKLKPSHGSKHYLSKLNEAEVVEIREMLSTGLALNLVSKMYEVSAPVISNIKHGKTWKHV